MFSKIILSLLTTTLITTSATFAMDNLRKNKKGSTHQRLQQKNDKKYQAPFKEVLDLYRDQAEYHETTAIAIKNKSVCITNNNIKDVVGLPLHVLQQPSKDSELESLGENNNTLTLNDLPSHLKEKKAEKFVKIDTLFEDALNIHTLHAEEFKKFVKLREESTDSIFEKIALIYCRSTINSVDTIDKISIRKEEFKKTTYLTEEQIDKYYEIKVLQDKILFYQRVQNKILLNFKNHLNEIYIKMIGFACNELKVNTKDLSQVLKNKMPLGIDFSQFSPAQFKMSQKDKEFYESVRDKKYVFPTSLEEAVLPVQEDLSVENKKEPNLTSQTPIEGKNAEKNKKKNERKKFKKLLAKKNTEQTVSEETIPSTHLMEESKKDTSLLEEEKKDQNVENLILSQPKEEKKTPEVPNLPFTVLPEETMEKLNDHLEKKSDFQIEIENLTNKSQEQFAKDRKKKKKKKNVISKKIEKKEESIKINSITKKAEIRDTHHTFLEELCTTSVTNQNIRWTNVVSLFNSPAGFNGKVYGKNDGASNTFEVFLKFDTNGNLAKFLSEEEFNFLKEKAEPELKNNRKFLLKNGRLASYKLLANAGSIATSFFTLHNPHPSSFLYLDLLKRLKEQLELLGINHETVESKKEEK